MAKKYNKFTEEDRQIIRLWYARIGPRGVHKLIPSHSARTISNYGRRMGLEAPRNLGGRLPKGRRSRLVGTMMSRRQELAALAEIELPPEPTKNIWGRRLKPWKEPHCKSAANAWSD